MVGGIFNHFRSEANEPIEHGPFLSPIVFGRRRHKFRRNVSADIRTIDLNAGKMTIQQIADAMGLSPSRVKALAASAKPPIDLTLKKEPEPTGA